MTDNGPWELELLHTHLQRALELELWTIPYYTVALASLEDPRSRAHALLDSILAQELVHVLVLANVANAYDLDLEVDPPIYGAKLPHLDFDLDTPNPTSLFAPHSTALGPLDHPRLNTMCLIEYPTWPSLNRSRPLLELDDYISVTDFHDALRLGARDLREHVRGGRRQLDGDASSYPDLDGFCVTKDRAAGYEQVAVLLDLLREQGEGARLGDEAPPRLWPTDDPEPGSGHFAKFNELRDATLAQTHGGGGSNAAAEAAFADELERLCASWARAITGDATELERPTALIDAARECWRLGVVPRSRG